VDDILLGIVCHRLDDQPPPSGLAGELVLAACESADAVRTALGGAPVAHPPVTDSDVADLRDAAGAYLASVTVQGFRGVGPARELPLDAGPGLTVVVGRNGSGKSSFAEALELLVTGRSDRLERTTSFRDGWRNLHWSGEARLAAELAIDSAAGRTSIEQTWPPGAGELDAGAVLVRVPGTAPAGRERLGWDEAVSLYRPFLSHAELEALWGTKPSELHDRLSQVLGLDDLGLAAANLAAARKDLDSRIKELKAMTGQVVAGLDIAAAGDERATRARQLLRSRTPDLGALRAIATGTDAPPAEAAAVVLAALSRLSGPDRGEVDRATAALSAGAGALRRIAGSDAARAASLAELLRRAIGHRADHGDAVNTCPVCGSGAALDDAWATQTTAHIEQLDREAAEVQAAHDQADAAIRQASALLSPVPATLDRADDATDGVDPAPACEAWRRWASAPAAERADPDSLEALARHLAAHANELIDAVGDLAEAARIAIERRQDRWAPLAEQLAAWCVRAEAVGEDRPALAALKQAETWLKGATDDIRNDRLQPIAEQAQRFWSMMRQESNVDLGPMRLSGTATRRRVDLPVSVDGTNTDALGVMSQGEMNALALAVFLPRATLAESPFRFVVIDDPVQAMDPSKVDGLARVLDELASTRQVIVFTHDDRLPESIRRLDIAARLVEVTRQPGSVVTIRPCGDPVERMLADARAVAHDPGVPAAVAAKVIPGLCRVAAEAACTGRARQQLLRDGVGHAEVEGQLAAAQKLLQKAALAMLGDSGRSGDVLNRLDRSSRVAADTLKRLNSGAHGAWSGDGRGLVRDTAELISAIDPSRGR
jgi:recombinational DNA repair ATPase RecF